MPRTKDKTTSSSTKPNPPLRPVEEEITIALSYDDVLLIPQRTSLASRRQAETSTLLSRNIFLHIPIVSANMDTVHGVRYGY